MTELRTPDDVDDRTTRFQQTANQTGFSRFRLESEWWGNEKFGEWRKEIWALVDAETDDAYHLAVVAFDDAYLTELRPHKHQTDVWFPKDKAEIIAEPNWTTFAPDDTPPKGTIYVAMSRRTEYGWKIGLWGDTYDALSQEGDAALDHLWDDVHAAYEGGGWAADEVNALVIRALTHEGYTVKIVEELMD